MKMLDPIQDMKKITDVIFEQMFDYQWKKIQHRNMKGIVKQKFVKNIFFEVLKECHSKLLDFSINPLDFDITYDTMEQGRIIEQIYYYHRFYTSYLGDAERIAKQNSKEYQAELINVVSGNILVGDLHKVNFLTEATMNSPEIIVYKIFADRIIAKMAEYTNKQQCIISTLIIYFMSAVKAIVNLIAEGQGSSAVPLWRQLHEQECIITVLLKSDESAIDAYWNHQRFYNLQWYDNKELEEELKGKMKDSGEKKRRNYINYGWLLEIDDFKCEFNKSYELNFKNGLQAFAGQSQRYDAFANASMIIHSSGKMLAISSEMYYASVMQDLYDTISHLTPQLIQYLETNKQKYFSQEEDYTNLIWSINRDLEQLKNNNDIIAIKFSA